MRLNKSEFKSYIKSNHEKLNNHLTIRILYLLDQLIIFEDHEDEEVELFEILIRLLFLADESPSESIANLMVPLNTDSSYLLDNNTITDSASFIRDYLKKDYILYIMRQSELRNLKVKDVDSKRMLIHIRNSKGKKDRQVPLTPTLLACLRTYWKLFRANNDKKSRYLFQPRKNSNSRRFDKPLSHSSVGYILRRTAHFAGIKKKYILTA